MTAEDPSITGKSIPSWTPGLLRNHPALLVEWLQLLNSLSRWREDRRRVAVIGFSSIAILGALMTGLSGHVVATVELLAEYWLLLAVLTAIFAATTVNGRRRRLEESQWQSWLIATPIPPSSLQLSHAIRTLFPLLAIALIVVVFLGVLAITTNVPSVAVGTVIGAVAAGLLLGSSAGWWASRGRKQTAAAASRYVPRPRVRGSLRPDATGLAQWPISQVLSWSRPENSRYILIAALLAVQGGSSAVVGLSVVAMYFVASYLAALLSAMTTVAKSASTWLRATPITLSEFVWSLSRRALAHQLIGAALAVLFMSLLGASFSMALQLAALWLGLVISISGFALVDNYRGRSPLVKIALSVATVAALMTVAQLRAGAKT